MEGRSLKGHACRKEATGKKEGRGVGSCVVWIEAASNPWP